MGSPPPTTKEWMHVADVMQTVALPEDEVLIEGAGSTARSAPATGRRKKKTVGRAAKKNTAKKATAGRGAAKKKAAVVKKKAAPAKKKAPAKKARPR